MKNSDATRRAFPRRIRRVALCLLLPLVLSLSLLSCGGDRIEPADEGEAIAAAERLIGEAEVWVRLFYTEGGMPILEGGRQNGRYREVDGAEMERLGFRRLSDLKDYERSIFSPSVCEAQDAALFTGGGGAWRAALIENIRGRINSLPRLSAQKPEQQKSAGPKNADGESKNNEI